MKNFTQEYNSRNKKLVTEEDYLYKGNYISIVNKDGWDIVKEKDMVIVLPYLIDEDSVIFRLENVPTYNTIQPHIDLFPTLMSGSIEPDESVESCIRRELEEELGLKIKPNVKLEILKNLHVSKGNIARYNICILPINSLDYDIIFASTDGSKSEQLSKNIKIKTSLFKEVQFFDVVSEYVKLMFFNKYFSPVYNVNVNNFNL